MRLYKHTPPLLRGFVVNIISTSYGNDSKALMQWAVETNLPDVTVCYIDTGWASEDWHKEIKLGEAFAKKAGFKVVRIKPVMQFEELMVHKKGFPNQRYQWCSGLLKGVPFLQWVDEVDPEAKAVVIIGKRREESRERAETPEFIEASDYHGGRKIWHPLFEHSEVERNDLLERAGFKILGHRSKECHPCTNANRYDFRSMGDFETKRLQKLEGKVNKTMFRPKRHAGAQGIVEVIKWAEYSPGQFSPEQEELDLCTSGMCGI